MIAHLLTCKFYLHLLLSGKDEEEGMYTPQSLFQHTERKKINK
jgi:hypothetical protein